MMSHRALIVSMVTALQRTKTEHCTHCDVILTES